MNHYAGLHQCTSSDQHQTAERVQAYWSAEEFVAAGLPHLQDKRCAIIEMALPSSESNGRTGPSPLETVVMMLVSAVGNVRTAARAIPERSLPPARPFASLPPLRRRIEELLVCEARRLDERCADRKVEQLLDDLSRREWDVLLGLVRGMSCKQLAAQLEIGLPTVTKHRSHLFRKLHVSNVAEMMTLLWSASQLEAKPLSDDCEPVLTAV
jgi:two-component system response regulator FixJ